ncbi:MAG: AraC family transcriptional regulator [Sphaerochaetaceae bacterium]|nr:AraC family transcriptional regulator [Sphaerochaetaceae bacterium]
MGMKPSEDISFSAYLKITKKDKDFLLYSTFISHTIIAPSQIVEGNDISDKSEDPNHVSGIISPVFKLLYVTEGESSFRSFSGEVDITAGTFILIVPGERYSYHRNPALKLNEYCISFDGDLPRLWLQNRFLPSENMVYEYGISQSLIKLFDSAVSLAQKNEEGFQQMIASILVNIITKFYLKRTYHFDLSRETSLLEAAKMLFEENIFEKFDVEMICRQLKVNYYTLRSYFKDHTGYSPYQYLLNMKIEKAKELLQERNASVKEVAFTLAFDSPYYFSRLFKAKTGISPSRWADPYNNDSH